MAEYLNDVTLFVSAEGRGETEATEKAPGAPEAGLSVLPQNPAAAQRPGTMETPHSAQTSQHAGKSPVMTTAAAESISLPNPTSLLQLSSLRIQEVLLTSTRILKILFKPKTVHGGLKAFHYHSLLEQNYYKQRREK